MKIDLHIHSKNGSDGRWNLKDIFAEAKKREIGLISITDHDSIAAQEEAKSLADSYSIGYIPGVELNVTYSHPDYKGGKTTRDQNNYFMSNEELHFLPTDTSLSKETVTLAGCIYTYRPK